MEDAAAIVETNLLGTIRVARALTPSMTARGRGHVVLIGSQAGVMTFAGDAAYIASKWGVHGFARALKTDLQGTGVRVTEILPGAVKTEFAAARLRGDHAKAEEFYAAFKELLAPEDVAATGPYTVRFSLAKPYAPFLATLSQLFVLNRAQVLANKKPGAFGASGLMADRASLARSRSS